jgi:hypothetical protein
MDKFFLDGQKRWIQNLAFWATICVGTQTGTDVIPCTWVGDVTQASVSAPIASDFLNDTNFYFVATLRAVNRLFLSQSIWSSQWWFDWQLLQTRGIHVLVELFCDLSNLKAALNDLAAEGIASDLLGLGKSGTIVRIQLRMSQLLL